MTSAAQHVSPMESQVFGNAGPSLGAAPPSPRTVEAVFVPLYKVHGFT